MDITYNLLSGITTHVFIHSLILLVIIILLLIILLKLNNHSRNTSNMLERADGYIRQSYNRIIDVKNVVDIIQQYVFKAVERKEELEEYRKAKNGLFPKQIEVEMKVGKDKKKTRKTYTLNQDKTD